MRILPMAADFLPVISQTWRRLTKIPAKRIQGEDVEKYAGKFLEQNGPELLEIMLEHGTYAYPKTCLGEPIHNQQPYIPKPIFDELMEL